jgi:hypothetical protein
MTDAASASSTPPPNTLAGLAAQIPKDLGFAGAPPALADAVEAMRKIMMQQSEEIMRVQEQNKRFLEAETKRKDLEKAEAERYAESRKGVAKDLVAEMVKIAMEDGMAEPTEAYKEMAMVMHTDNSPLSKENQAVTVACMRKLSKLDQELAATKARNLELETAAKTLHDMTTVDEAERSERRDLKVSPFPPSRLHSILTR